jgi:hypothetical protein
VSSKFSQSVSSTLPFKTFKDTEGLASLSGDTITGHEDDSGTTTSIICPTGLKFITRDSSSSSSPSTRSSSCSKSMSGSSRQAGSNFYPQRLDQLTAALKLHSAGSGILEVSVSLTFIMCFACFPTLPVVLTDGTITVPLVRNMLCVSNNNCHLESMPSPAPCKRSNGLMVGESRAP